MKVFLKFNRDTTSARICLDHWLKIFENDEVTIICDLFKEGEAIPKRLAGITRSIVNTDYKLSVRYNQCFGGGKRDIWFNAGAANLTAYKEASKVDKFWLIDADDTMFVSSDFSVIRNKLKLAEDYFDQNNLDGFSIDFYRELVNDHWSFGVCLLNSKTNLDSLLSVTPEDQLSIIKYINLDGAFDVLRRKGIFKLESFVFDNMFFHHHVDRPGVSYGLYYWNNKKLWDKIKLLDNIVIL